MGQGGEVVRGEGGWVSQAKMIRNAEHTAGVKIKDVFQNGYLMVMPAKTLATTKVKIAKIYAFVRRNLMIYIGN